MIPQMKVSQIPFIERGRIITYEEKLAYGMTMSNGESNFYRVTFARGQEAAAKKKLGIEQNIGITVVKAKFHGDIKQFAHN